MRFVFLINCACYGTHVNEFGAALKLDFHWHDIEAAAAWRFVASPLSPCSLVFYFVYVSHLLPACLP